MILPVQSFSGLLEQMAAGVQGAATALIDMSVGSVMRAMFEACASVALWMQWLILQVLTMTRAATSSGADLDTWMADFSLSRLPGIPATGSVTFSRYIAGLATIIPVGTTVQTMDRSESFTVTADPSHAAWNGTNGYLLGENDISVTLPVQDTIPGSQGNIQPGTIGILSTAVPSVDTVSNANRFVGGMDTESDSALRQRFKLYINSLSLATVTSVLFSIASVQQGLRYRVFENQDANGNTALGNFRVVVDDGSGYLSAALQSALQSAVNVVRPIGSVFSVMEPNVILVNISMTLETGNVATQQATIGLIGSSISNWVSGLPIGSTLAISKLDALSHAADPSIISVNNVIINGSTTDLVGAVDSVFLINSISIT